jgi:hypothetical protein
MKERERNDDFLAEQHNDFRFYMEMLNIFGSHTANLLSSDNMEDTTIRYFRKKAEETLRTIREYNP